jgi:hypothetical protein
VKATTTTCEREGCQALAVVGIGDPVEWVCVGCYEAWLEEVGEVARRVKDLYRGLT